MRDGFAAPPPAAPRAVVQGKISVPGTAKHVISRPRVDALMVRMLETRRVVVVAATAGAGKTTAVVSGLSQLDRPTAWLTVDRTDVAPGRLLVYLESALAVAVPSAADAASAALSAGLPHGEAAAVLAEAIGDEPVVVVLDQVERLGEEPDAWAVIESFMRYLPHNARLVLLSRKDIPEHRCAMPGADQLARIGETQLAFTVGEASEALQQLGDKESDPEVAVQATGGWVMGVLFEAWRSSEHVAGMGGEADPLDGYLSSHILAQLDDVDLEFLIASSILDEVTAPRAEALGLDRPAMHLDSLRRAHLPVSWSSAGDAMRCHSRFREYLQAALERRGNPEVRDLRVAHGMLLSGEGRFEEAADELIAVGALESAVTPVERCIVEVIQRLDSAVAEQWLEVLRGVAPEGAGPFATADLFIAIAHDDFRQAARVADELAGIGERETLAQTSPQSAWIMALAYMHMGRLDEVMTLVESIEPGPSRDAVEYTLGIMRADPDIGPTESVHLTGTPIDAIILVAEYGRGHLGRLVDAPKSKWADVVTRPWRIAGLRASGRTERALSLYEEAGGLQAKALPLRTFVGPEVLIDAGRRDDAVEALEAGWASAKASGSVGYIGFNTLAALKLALRIDKDTARAHELLDRPEFRSAAETTDLHVESSRMWRGCAALLEGDDAAALEELEPALESMLAGNRYLDLPIAAVYLAEARWRGGDEAGADRAADLALTGASRHGSNHVLLQALSDFPAVLSRRLDAEAEVGTEWHDLGRALAAQGAELPAPGQIAVELREFGREQMIINGLEAKARIVKSYELLSYLAVAPDHQAERRQILNDLFGGRVDDSTRAYLRQCVHWLRQAFGDRECIVAERAGPIRIAENVRVSSEAGQFASRLAEAARLQHRARLTATVEALEIYERGEFLPGAQSDWASLRRDQLEELAVTARLEAGEIALGLGRVTQARELTDAALQADPTREGGWRDAMRIAAYLGDEDRVIRVFGECERALHLVGAEPTRSTRELLALLRR